MLLKCRLFWWTVTASATLLTMPRLLFFVFEEHFHTNKHACTMGLIEKIARISTDTHTHNPKKSKRKKRSEKHCQQTERNELYSTTKKMCVFIYVIYTTKFLRNVFLWYFVCVSEPYYVRSICLLFTIGCFFSFVHFLPFPFVAYILKYE